MWWPFEGTLGDLYREGMAKLDKDESTEAILPNDRMFIPCHTWEIKMDPVKLLELPDLPDLLGTGLSEEECRRETKLIKITSFLYWVIGLTNKGHVLMHHGLSDEDHIGAWDYVCKSAQTILYQHSNGDTQLPNYSEIDKVKKHSAFCTNTGSDGKARPPEVELPSDTMLITDVSHIALISSEFLSEISQHLDLCAQSFILCLLILHGTQGRLGNYPNDTSDHHPRASEQICDLCCLWFQLLPCSHLLWEAPDMGHELLGRLGSWRPHEASHWIPRRVCDRGRTSSWTPTRSHSSHRSEV